MTKETISLEKEKMSETPKGTLSEDILSVVREELMDLRRAGIFFQPAFEKAGDGALGASHRSMEK